MKKNIALLAGGYSGEYVISIQTAATIQKNLDSEKFNTYKIIVTKHGWHFENEKGEKSEGESKKAEISVIVDENQAMKIIKNAKVITIQEMSRQTGVKVSTANAFLLKLLKSGEVKRIGGHSGHHIYQPVSS